MATGRPKSSPATENRLHQECTVWLHNYAPWERKAWHHNDNNSANAWTGGMKKSMGVTRGVWDLEWVTKTGATVWIEFKVGNNSLTRDQIEFKELIRERCDDHLFFVVRTLEEFQFIALKFL